MPRDVPPTSRRAKKEASWVEQQNYLYFLLPEALGKLVEYLAAAGQTQESLALARAVLAVHLVGDTNRRASARFDTWNYEQLLQKHFPEVIQRIGPKGLALLCQLLEGALVEESDGAENFSWIWRPAIEPHAQNHGHGEYPARPLKSPTGLWSSVAHEDNNEAQAKSFQARRT